MNAVIVDFSKRTNSRVTIGSVPLKKERGTFLFRMLNREIDIVCHSLSVTNLKYSDEIEIENASEFIQLQYTQVNQDKRSSALSEIHINSHEFKVDLICDTRKILDCSSIDLIHKSTVTFDVEMIKSPGSQPHLRSYSFDITILRGTSRLAFDVKLDEAFLDGYEYRKITKIQLGQILLSHQSEYKFCNALDNLNIQIETNNGLPIDGLYFFDRPVDGNLMNTSIESEDSNHADQIQFDRIGKQDTTAIPFYMDLCKIENPRDEIFKEGKVTLIFDKNAETLTKSTEFEFELLPDIRTTELKSIISFGETKIPLAENISIPNHYYWNKDKQDVSTSCFTFRLGNKAEDGVGSVKITKLMCRFDYHPETESHINNKTRDKVSNSSSLEMKQTNNLAEIFVINGEPSSKLVKDWEFSNGANSWQDFKISYRHDKISDIPGDLAWVVCHCSFEYQIFNKSVELGDDLQQEPITINSIIHFKLEKYTGNHWLALDFGTSASVAAFANGEMYERKKSDELLLDMQSLLREKLERYDDADIEEKGTKFLSSDMMLRSAPNVYINTNDFKEDIIHLSPPTDSAYYFKYRIPYLKSLVGFEDLPDVAGNYDNYKYAQDKLSSKLVFKDKPLKVKTILTNTYNSLIRDFVLPSIGQKEKLNKLIVTIPNTFTPRHVDYLRAVISDKFPFFRNDYIDFLSESDAVVCHYLSNWNKLNYDRKDKIVLREIGNVEYVLVYDIGAGTTDITYCKIATNDNHEQAVEIIGRLGKSTAGNYLDYVIAKIIEDKLPEDQHYDFFSSFTNEEDRSKAFELKKLIKEKIKPYLEDDITVNASEGGRVYIGDYNENDTPISSADILNHNRMQIYIMENSEEILERFFSLFYQTDSSLPKLSKGNVPINTVIFSGRTIQFESLREALKRSINKWSSKPDIQYIEHQDGALLKSVVVEGAMQYAMTYRNTEDSLVKISSRNLLARYGVIYTNLLGEKEFVELLNPSTRPISGPVKKSGISVYQYDSDQYNALTIAGPAFVNMRNSKIGYFVQSFSTDTAGDLSGKEENWDYITKMYQFDRDDIAGDISKVKVRVEVNRDNEMKITVGGDVRDPQAPLKIELFNDPTFQKSMWPYL